MSGVEELEMTAEISGGSAVPELPAAEAATRALGEAFLVSPQQERLLELQGEENGYFARLALRIQGTVDPWRLNLALREVIDRQEMLRVTFLHRPGEAPLQVISPQEEPRMPVVDLRILDSTRRQEAVDKISQHQAQLASDLRLGPALHLCLVRLAADTSLLLLRLPTLCADYRGLAELFRQITECYVEPRLLAPHERPMPFSQFSAWQRQLLELPEAAEERAFWSRQDGPPPARSPLPLEVALEEGGQERLQTYPARMSDASRLRMVEWAERVGTDLEACFLAVWWIVLSRFGSRSDLILTRTCGGRSYDEVEGTVGLFEKQLPLRAKLDLGRSFGRFARSLGNLVEEAEDFHEYFDGARLEELCGATPRLPPIGFEMVAAPQPYEADGMRFTVAGLYARTDRLRLQLRVIDLGEGLRFELVYDARRFSTEDIVRLWKRFEVLLRGALADPDRAVAELPWLDPAERRQVLGLFNRTAAYYGSQELLHSWFEEVAARLPEQEAVVAEDGRLSFNELEKRANQVAWWLLTAGVKPDQPVGVALERGVHLPVALLGILKAGAAYVPLDPEYPSQRLAFMVRDSRLRWVVTADPVETQAWGVGLKVLHLDGREVGLRQQPTTPPGRALTGTNLAYGIYTSGSTGQPKAALNSHGAVVNRLRWMQQEMGLEPGEAVLHKTPYSFDVSVWEIFWPLLCGGRLVLARPGGQKEPAYLAELIVRERVTTVHFVPPMLAAFLEEEDLEGPAAQLRRIVCSGETLPAAVRDRCQARLPAVLYNLYGPTEAAIDVTSWRCERSDRRPWVPIGRPIANTRIFILDPFGRALPLGTRGEIHLAGAGLARGYAHRPALTASHFLPDSFSGLPGSRLYRTGDLGSWDPKGVLRYHGRRDGQVKIRGYRIEPGEAEAVLLSHPRVRSAVVTTAELREGLRLVAYVVPQTGLAHGGELAPADLRRFLAKSLPEHLIPSILLLLHALPLLPNGKVDRSALPAPRLAETTPEAAPRTELEALLAEIWMEVLGLPSIGVHDEFLTLGGDSILAMQIVARANRHGLDLVPGQLFESPTVAELAAKAQELRPRAAEPIDLSPAPLAPMQSWFFDQGFPHPHHWNQAVMLEGQDPLEEGRLRSALRSLERRHGALRLRFHNWDGQWWQRVDARDSTPDPKRLDVSGLEETERERAVESFLADLHGSLNLEKGPLWQAGWIHGGATEQVVLIVHHLAVDGFSWRLLLGDFLELLEGRQTLPELPPAGSYLEWARSLEKELAADCRVQAQAWLAMPWSRWVPMPQATGPGPDLAGPDLAGPDLAGPDLAGPDLAGPDLAGEEQIITDRLAGPATRMLIRQLPLSLRADMTEILLAALGRALTLGTDSTVVAVDVETHGRRGGDEALVASTVGWFTSLFPFVFELPGGTEDRRQDVQAVKEQLRALPAGGQNYLLLCYRGPAAVTEELARLPRPQLLLNYLGQFDTTLKGRGELMPTSRPTGPGRHPENHRTHPLEVILWVEKGCLEISWSFNPAFVTAAAVRGLSDQFVDCLGHLLGTEARAAGAQIRQEDFPLCQLSSEELAGLVEAAGGAREVEDIYPLASSQDGMLLYLLLQTEDPAASRFPSSLFFNQLHCLLEGELQEEALVESWQEVVEAHGALRTEIHWRRLAQPVQLIRRQAQADWAVDDLRSVAPELREERFRALLELDRRQGFDLERAPLVRFKLVRWEADQWRFILSYHHLVLDGWSVSLMLKEAFGRYEARVQEGVWRGRPAPPFRDFVELTREQDLSAAEGFWRPALEGFYEPTSLRVERPQPGSAPVPRCLDRQLSPADGHRLKSLARGWKVTPNTVLQGAWALTLHEASGRSDVVFGGVVSGREMGFASTLGLFINALPVRSRLQPGLPVQEWLHGMQATQVAQRRFECCPLEQIQRWSQLPREQGLFQTLLVFENYPVEQSLLRGQGELKVRDLEVEETTNYPLALFVFPGDRPRLEINFDAAFLDEASADCLLNRLGVLLDRLCDGPDGAVQSLLGPSSAERRQLVEESPHGPALQISVRGVHELFEAQAALDPAAPAVVLTDSSEPGTAPVVWTYGKLNRRANQLAFELLERGVRPGDRIGLRLERTPRALAALLAVLKVGAAYVPLDLGWPAERCRRILASVGTVMLITETTVVGSAEIREGRVFALDEDGAVALRPVENPALSLPAEGTAYILHTSGTSGRPKGVVVGHRALIAHTLSAAAGFHLTARDRTLQFASLAFDASAEEIFPTLARGAALVLRTEAMLSSARAFWQSCAHWGVTVVDLPTSFWHQLVVDPAAPEALPESLRLVVIGGEKAETERLEQWLGRYGDEVRLLNTYGPTEATVVATRAELGPLPATVGTRPELPIGRPMEHVQVCVLDGAMEPVAAGVPGELFLGGLGLAQGYWGQPAATAQRFLPHPFAAQAGERLYRTGDLGRWLVDGQLQFLGRLDAQVKVRGQRIEPAEIEAVLIAMAEIREAAVVLRREGPEPRLAAVLAGEAVAPDRLRERLRQVLPEFMVPVEWHWVPALPRTAGGKIDRRALLPAVAAPSRTVGFLAPRNETEEILAELFSELLEVESVGALDNFFDLGGHSLLATRLAAQIREIFEVEVPLRSIFEAPSVAQLSATVANLILDELEELEELAEDRSA